MFKKWTLFGIAILFNPYLYSQNVREKEEFNSNWQFKLGASGQSTNFNISHIDKEWSSINIPHTYNREDMQNVKGYYTGDAYYKKVFSIDRKDKGKRVFLRFEGVGSVADVFLNGKFVSEHKGAYAAFALEITDLLHYGEKDTLVVKTNNVPRKDIIPINNFLFPVYGGIYRPVDLIITSPINFTVTDNASPGVYIRQQTSAKESIISYLAKIENKYPHHQAVIIRATIKDKTGKTILTQDKKADLSPQGIYIEKDTLRLTSPHLWDGVKDPYLYSVTTEIIQDKKVIDVLQQPLGLRHIELIAGKGVYLNGKKYPMYGVTRHQDWEGFGSALSNQQHRSDLTMIREMGATTIRLAHYQQSDYVYSLADSLGLLIWAEIPFVNATSLEESENAQQQMRELVRQNSNHPSIYLWGMHNEVYSRNKDEHVPVLTRELNDICKTDDPDRPTVSVSGYGEIDRPSNLAGDVQGINRYYGWYEGDIKDLDKWGSYLEKDFGDYKIMLSEYGADANIDQHSDTLPSASSIDPLSGKFYPESYQTEMHIQQWAAIEKHPIILASYIWNMFEFAVPAWSRGGVPARNLKGLVTFDRKRKKDAFYWYKANWNPEPMIYLAGRRDSIRHHSTTSIQFFSNLNNVELILNGQKIKVAKGLNDKHWICKDAPLHKGKNDIVATGISSSGKKLKDEMEWILQ